MTVETCPHDPAKRKKFGVRHRDGLDFCETCFKVTPESLYAMQNQPTYGELARQARERYAVVGISSRMDTAELTTRESVREFELSKRFQIPRRLAPTSANCPTEQSRMGSTNP